jgi:transcriptional regulator with XRE-family HTH domain
MERKMVTYSNNTFSKIRLASGMSVEDVAKTVGCSVSTVKDWEAGLHHPRKVYIRLLKKHYADFDLDTDLTFAYNTGKASIFQSTKKAA